MASVLFIREFFKTGFFSNSFFKSGLADSAVGNPLLLSWALTTSLTPEKSAGSPTFTRASGVVFQDFEDLYHYVTASNEAVFKGARRVENLARGTYTTSAFASDSDWDSSGTSGISFSGERITPQGNTDDRIQTKGGVFTPVVGVEKVIFSFTASAGTAHNMRVKVAQSPYAVLSDTTLQVTTTPKRYSFSGTSQSVAAAVYFMVYPDATNGTDYIDFSNFQIERVTGQTITTIPSEYISFATLSAPYHGAGVTGVKYFNTENGNTVASNVVTEATGSAIAAATLDGIQLEPASTNKITAYSLPGADKLGSDFAVNGGFVTDTGWAKNTGWTIPADGTAVFSGTAGSFIYQGSLSFGKVYSITFTIESISSGSFTARLGNIVGTARITTGTYTESFVSNTTNNFGVHCTASGGAVISNFSIKEIGGTKISDGTHYSGGGTGAIAKHDGTFTGTSPDIQNPIPGMTLSGGEKVGSELVTNGNFTAWTGDNPDGWIVTEVGDATSNVTENPTGQAQIISDGTNAGISQIILTIGKLYSYSIDIKAITGTLFVGDNAGSGDPHITTGVKTGTFLCVSTSFIIKRQVGNSVNATIDDISVKELTYPATLEVASDTAKITSGNLLRIAPDGKSYKVTNTGTSVANVDLTGALSAADHTLSAFVRGASAADDDVNFTTDVDLVSNGDAELDSDWVDYGTPTTNERSSEQAHSGIYSRKFVVDSAYDGTKIPFSTVLGKKYRITASVYGDGTNKGILLTDGNANVYSSLTATAAGYVYPASWTTETWTFTANATTTKYVIFASGTGVTTFTGYIDDVSVKPIDEVHALTDEYVRYDSTLNAKALDKMRIEVPAGDTVYFTLPQAEAQSVPTSPIIVEGAAATRAVTSLTIPIAGNFSNSQGMAFVDWTPSWDFDTNVGLQEILRTAATGRFFYMQSGTLKVLAGSGGSTNNITYSEGSTYKMGLRWGVSVDELQIGTDGAVDPTPDNFAAFGTGATLSVQHGGGLYGTNWFKNIKIYNVDKGTTFLETETTP